MRAVTRLPRLIQFGLRQLLRSLTRQPTDRSQTWDWAIR